MRRVSYQQAGKWVAVGIVAGAVVAVIVIVMPSALASSAFKLCNHPVTRQSSS